MTPLEMYVEARRRRMTPLEMLEHGAKNLAHMRGKCLYSAAELEEQRKALEWLQETAVPNALSLDVAILDWRWAPWPRGRLQASLVTLNGETVGTVAAGSVARNFGWTLFKPSHWVIDSDPDAMAARAACGQDAVESYVSGLSNRVLAGKSLVEAVQRKSIGLRGVDHFHIPPFRVPKN